MSASFTIIMAAPDRVLSPNARAHWSAIAKARKRQRTAAWAATLASGVGGVLWPAATVDYLFTYRVKRKRDDDNLVASMKSARDGIASAGVVKDDNDMHTGTVRVEIDRGASRDTVRITVTRGTAAE